MLLSTRSIVVAGAGIFGLSGALELRSRGYVVTVVDPGPVPHPLAASNDVSRMVRMDYGDDKLYSDLGAEAIEGWHVWNERRGRPLYHEDGFLILTSHPLEQGAVERQSYDLLTAAGWPLERLDSKSVADRFPLWNAEHYTDGYFNPRGGWAEAGETVSYLAAEAVAAGIEIRPGFQAESVLVESGRAVGLRAANGAEVRADGVVVAAGVWTPRLLPEMQDMMSPVAQTLVYLRPNLPERFRPPHFPPWGADIPRTGWYGFPANAEGVVKMANHGPGRVVDADDPRDADPAVVEYSRDGSCRTRCRSWPTRRWQEAGPASTTTLGTATFTSRATRKSRASSCPPAAVDTPSSSHRRWAGLPPTWWKASRTVTPKGSPGVPAGRLPRSLPGIRASRGRMALRHSCEGRNPVLFGASDHSGA